MYGENDVGDKGERGGVRKKFVVGGVWMVVVGVNEVVVKVKVIVGGVFEVGCGEEGIEEECVECVWGIEMIGVWGMRGV